MVHRGSMVDWGMINWGSVVNWGDVGVGVGAVVGGGGGRQ